MINYFGKQIFVKTYSFTIHNLCTCTFQCTFVDFQVQVFTGIVINTVVTRIIIIKKCVRVADRCSSQIDHAIFNIHTTIVGSANYFNVRVWFYTGRLSKFQIVHVSKITYYTKQNVYNIYIFFYRSEVLNFFFQSTSHVPLMSNTKSIQVYKSLQ